MAVAPKLSKDAQLELKSVSAVVRALVNSKKPPCSLREIVRDYNEVENEPLPYRRLGFSNPEQLVHATGEFHLNRVLGELCIIARINPQTQHIASMVQNQKPSKSSRLMALKPITRHPRRPDNGTWNKSSYSTNVYHKLPPSNLNYRRYGGYNKNFSQQRGNTARNALLPTSQMNSCEQMMFRYKQQQAQRAGIQQKQQTKPQIPQSLQQRQLQQQQLRLQYEQQEQLRQQRLQKSETAQNKMTHQEPSKKQPEQQQNPKQHQQKPSDSENKQERQPSTQQVVKENGAVQNSKKHESQEQVQRSQILYGGKGDLRDFLNAKGKQQQEPVKIVNNNKPDLRDVLYQKQLQRQKLQIQQEQQEQQQKLKCQPNQQQQMVRPILGQNCSNKKDIGETSVMESSENLVKQQAALQKSLSEGRLRMLQIKSELNSSLQDANNNIDINMPLTKNINNTNNYENNIKTLLPSIQDRLKKKLNITIQNDDSGIETSKTLSSPPTTPNVNESPTTEPFHFDTSIDPVTLLSNYCYAKGYPQPEYTVNRTKFSKVSKYYQGRVLLNNKTYTTYPREFVTPILAKISCAELAVTSLIKQETRLNLPISDDADTEIIRKLHAEILQHPCGIFAKNIADLFEKIYKKKLPNHWWKLISNCPKFTLEQTANENHIVFANDDENDNYESAFQFEEVSVLTLPENKLPWGNRNWNLQITAVTSTIEVWGRLIGYECSDDFQCLLTELNDYMKKSKERPIAITPKEIYLYYNSNCWNRVRVEDVDKANATAQCFFLDFGDLEWIPVTELYICVPNFLHVAPQAVVFSLYGLEDFAENPTGRKVLEEMLVPNSYVGEILTKETGYVEGCSIQTVLFDTSSDEDINMNQKALEEISIKTRGPELQLQSVKNVFITNITNDGAIFLVLLNNDWNYVENLINQIIESKFNKEQHRIKFADLHISKRLLVYDDNLFRDKTNNDSKALRWFRGVLVSDPKMRPTDDVFDVYFIDIGSVRRVHISKMFLLEKLSAALSHFPAQVIKTRLRYVPEIKGSALARLHELLPLGCKALVRLDIVSDPPLVMLYRHLNDSLCTINDVLRIEYDDFETNTQENVTASQKSNTTPTISVSATPIAPTTAIVTTKTPNKYNELPKLRVYDRNSLPIGVFFELNVTMVANPTNFMIQIQKDLPQFRALMRELQEVCDLSDEYILGDLVEVGQAYAAHHPDGFFHRVIVQGKINAEMIQVNYCDFGDNSILRNSQLKLLPYKFRQLPIMAIPAKLHGVRPTHGNDWTVQDCARFRQLTVGKRFMGMIKKFSDELYDSDNTEYKILEMELIDVSTSDDIHLNGLLRKESRGTS